MLESNVLHQSGTGRRGEDSNLVGISWKAPTKSHPSPSLVVTCSHQVIVYKPGESRRTHQWSFKPSAATVLSHAAVYLPSGSRYVGVQQGSTLVSWRESELDVKRPLSSQASGVIQAVHSCPHLGDYFVAVLASGGVACYHGGLQCVARCDAAGSGDDGAGSTASAKAKAVWSGVRGNKVLVLENIGTIDRMTTFVLSANSSSRRTDTAAAGTAPAAGDAIITLVSSHVLPKPSPTAMTVGGGGAAEQEAAVGGEVSACSAAILGGERGSGGNVMSVAWKTPRGPVWTKVVVGTGGARLEFARSTGEVAGGAVVVGAVVANGAVEDGGRSRVAPVALSNGHDATGSPKSPKSPKNKKSKKSATRHEAVVSKEVGIARRCVSTPAVAAADGGRLLVHSGGASARLAIWDAAYGVLLEDSEAPETAREGDAAVSGARNGSSVLGMMVSGDGAHLALAVSGRVLICPLPVKEGGTLASLLRRKRPTSSSSSAVASVSGAGSRSSFPSVDLARSTPASNLLEHTGALEAAKWEAVVVLPFREAEAEVVRSLEDAARRKDGDAFELVLREHLQQRAEDTGVTGFDSDEAGQGASGGEEGRRRKRPSAHVAGDYSAGVVAAAVELCLSNPNAKLWGALAVLVRSGGVSARHHRGLVAAIVEQASTELLEEVMLHVPDLPEADAVRILRYFLSQAATLAKTAKPPPALLTSGVPSEAGDEPSPSKRGRDNGGSGNAVDTGVSPGSSPPEGVSLLAAVSRPSKRTVDDMMTTGEKKKHKKNKTEEGEAAATAVVIVEAGSTGAHGHKTKGSNGAAAATASVVSNGNSTPSGATHDDGRTSSDSGGGSEGETPEAGVSSGTGNSRKMDTPTEENVKNKRSRMKRTRGTGARSAETPAARAERGVRVALTLPHNEAFLRSALAGLSHGEVLVVLKVLTRLLGEGRTLEGAGRGSKLRGFNAVTARGLPSARMDSVVGWASAVVDAHFTRLAIGGAADAGLVGALKALKRATRGEAECCELLSQVRALVDEVGRRHAEEAAEKSRRRPTRKLFTLRVLRF